MNEQHPDVIYSFAQEPNLLALLLGRAAKAKVVWGVRRSTATLPWREPLTVLTFFLGALFSRFADRVAYNSHCGSDLHVRRGYTSRNLKVIPNGFDTGHFKPDAAARLCQRQKWGIRENEPVIGIVGRINPVKDHALFFHAAADLIRTRPDARFVVVGDGPEAYRQGLEDQARRLGVSGRVVWAGECVDMVAAYNALDVVALCSKEEGCPNVVGEAMACGVLCAVTDVGDASRLVGDTGLVTQPGNWKAMAESWRFFLRLTEELRREQGQAARQHIVQEYSLHSMVDKTAGMLEELRQ